VEISIVGFEDFFLSFDPLKKKTANAPFNLKCLNILPVKKTTKRPIYKITATLGTLKLRPLLTGGRCSEVVYIIKIEIGPFKWWLS
jgi:hypothetical protein